MYVHTSTYKYVHIYIHIRTYVWSTRVLDTDFDGSDRETMESKYSDAAANVDLAINSGATVMFEVDGTKCVLACRVFVPHVYVIYMYIYIYIYMHMHTHMCVCVCTGIGQSRSKSTARSAS
jgi:hypothetical protein